MKCRKCGYELDKGILNCPVCGSSVSQTNHPLGLLSFIVSMLSIIYNPFGILSIIGITLGIVSLVLIRKKHYYIGLSVGGICIGVATGFYLIALYTFMPSLMHLIFPKMKN